MALVSREQRIAHGLANDRPEGSSSEVGGLEERSYGGDCAFIPVEIMSLDGEFFAEGLTFLVH